MPQYRSNQFVSDWLKPQAGESQNAPFQYPRRVIRTSDFDGNGNRGFATKELDRGFMRSLITETVSPTSGLVTQQTRQRFNFQFNPAAIQQEVQMRQDIYLPILQDPVQFAQPMSAVATFNFELLLDRTMEVGNNAVLSGPEERRASQVDLFGESNPATDVYQIGVLSDLQVLYAIIGQGFSNKFIEAQLEQMKTQAKIDAKYAENPETTQSDIDSLTADKFEANFGNNAFLIPMPVRIVFSELFMVDGFVTSTSVRFTKFNTNMVPIQASIGISMNALYIGFAKEKTFLTVQLENAKNITLQDVQTSVAEQAELLDLARASANNFVFYCDGSEEEDWLDAFSSDDSHPQPIKVYIKYASGVESDYNLNREFKVGFKDAETQGNDDRIETYYENGGTGQFSYNWTFTVYGPYNTLDNAKVDANGNKTRGTSNFVSAFTGIKKLAEYTSSSNPTATDKSSWLRIRSDSIRDDDAEAKPVGGESVSGVPTDYDDKYFLVAFYANVTAGQTIPLSTWKALKGDQQFKYERVIGWPNTSGVGGNTSGVSGSGYADDPKVNEFGRLVGGT